MRREHISSATAILAVFLLFSSALRASEPISLYPLSQELAERWNARLVEKVFRPAPAVLPLRGGKPYFSRSCGIYYVGHPQLLLFSTLKFRFEDPFHPLIQALSGCERMRLELNLPTNLIPPHVAGVLYEQISDGILHLQQPETADAFPAIFSIKLLLSALEPDEEFEVANADPKKVEDEIAYFTPESAQLTTRLEYFGSTWLRVDVYWDSKYAIIRSKDKWCGYHLSPRNANALKSALSDLQAIYADSSPLR